jgi:DNA-binding NarL/FixJ family response regulator
MRLVIWSPIALIAEALGVLFGREADVEVVAVVGSADVTSMPATLQSADLLVSHAVPLDECRRLFARLAPPVWSSLVAVYVAPSPDSLFESRARLFGFAEVIDSTRPTTDVISALREIARSGPSVGETTTWTFESNPPIASLVCSHCRDERDVEILQFIVDGHTDSRIAELMNLNAQTVRNRVSNMLLESGMSNRTQLAIDFYRAMLSLRGVDASSWR